MAYLQKVRWRCQMCVKQCGDENGFRHHQMSEEHLRRMEVFAQNPSLYVAEFTEEFEANFLDLMKRSHRFSRIAATVVYNEYINARDNVHIYSTEWATLTDFVKHLGETGKCIVEDTPRGWFITYINRDSEAWLCEGIVVKVMSKSLAQKGYFEQKGVVTKLIDAYVGEIQMLQSKHVLRVDQEELETVIPQIGCRVRILNGSYRGSNARLIGIDTVQIEEGLYDGVVIKDVEYKDICEVA